MKRVLLLVPMLFFCVCLTACGGKLDTTVELEADMSGRRIMEYEISKDEYNEHIRHQVSSIDAKIRMDCPEELSYEMKETPDSYIAAFTMEFDSIEDAEEKLAAIAANGEEYEIDCFQAEGVFCEGFVYEEKFAAEDPMWWFVKLMVNSGYIESTYSSYIISKSNTCLTYCGETYTSYNKLKVSQLSYIEISGIEIVTYANGDGTFNRDIKLQITDANLQKKETQIRTFMENSIPGGAVGNWINDCGMNTHTVSMENLSPEQMQEAMRIYTHTKTALFALGEPREREAEEYVLLSNAVCFEEYFDMREFASTADSDVDIIYRIKNANMEGELYCCFDGLVPWDPMLLGGKWIKWNPTRNYTGDFDVKPQGYDLSGVRDISLRYDGRFFYDVTEIYWNTLVKSKDNIRTEITFLMPDNVSRENLISLVEKCRTIINESPEKLKVKTDVKEVDSQDGICFIYEGTAAEHDLARNYLSKWSTEVTEFREAPSPIAYFEESKWNSLTKTCVFEEYVNPRGYLCHPSTMYIEIPIHYELDMPGKLSQEFHLTEAKNGVLQADFTYGTDNLIQEPVGAISTGVNVTGVCVLLLIIFGVLAILLALVFFILAIVKGIWRKNKKEMQKPVEMPAEQKEETYFSANDVADELVAELFAPNQN